MKIKKTLIIYALVTLLLTSIAFAIYAPANKTRADIQKNATSSINPVANNQERLIKNINHVAEKLDSIVVKIEGSKCEDSTIEASAASLEQLQKGILDFIPKVSGADSMDELKTVRKELIDYLKQHNKEVQDANKALKACAKEQTQATVNKLVANMAKIITVAKVKCPAESDALELQLQQINQTSQQLQDELQNGNTESAKQTGKQLMEQTQLAATLTKELYEKCVPDEMKPKKDTI